MRPRTAAGRRQLAGVELSPAGREAAVELCLRILDQLDRELAPIDRAHTLHPAAVRWVKCGGFTRVAGDSDMATRLVPADTTLSLATGGALGLPQSADIKIRRAS